MHNLDDKKLEKFNFYWQIISTPKNFKSVVPSASWYLALCLCWEILSSCFNISFGVWRLLPWFLRNQEVKMLAANAENCGFDSHRKQNPFFEI